MENVNCSPIAQKKYVFSHSMGEALCRIPIRDYGEVYFFCKQSVRKLLMQKSSISVNFELFRRRSSDTVRHAGYLIIDTPGRGFMM